MYDAKTIKKKIKKYKEIKKNATKVFREKHDEIQEEFNNAVEEGNEYLLQLRKDLETKVYEYYNRCNCKIVCHVCYKKLYPDLEFEVDCIHTYLDADHPNDRQFGEISYESFLKWLEEN